MALGTIGREEAHKGNCQALHKHSASAIYPAAEQRLHHHANPATTPTRHASAAPPHAAMRPVAATAAAALCLQLLAASALAQAQAPAATLGSAGPRPNTPAVQTCVCADNGINSPECFKAVTNYCQDTANSPDMKVCAAMSGFINNQDYPSGKVVAQFLVDTCRLVVPTGPSSCSCLEVRAVV